MSYVCRHFKLYELVPPSVYNARGAKGWQLFDDRALMTLDAMRDRYGSIIVNDWRFGGKNQWRGLRTPESPWFSPYSQHTFGRAFDCIFLDTTAEAVRQEIIEYPELFPHIRAIEDGVSWLHFDVRNCEPIMRFSK